MAADLHDLSSSLSYFLFPSQFSRQFSIFFIVYCVLVFAIAIQNINESYGEVKAYRGRIKIALLQPKSAVFTPGHDTTGVTIADDVDTIDDSHLRTRIPLSGSDGSYMREMKNLFCLPSMGNAREAVGDGAIGQKMDCNEFVIEALLRCHAIDYDRDLEPILNVSTLLYSNTIFNIFLDIESADSRLYIYVSIDICMSISISISIRMDFDADANTNIIMKCRNIYVLHQKLTFG